MTQSSLAGSIGSAGQRMPDAMIREPKLTRQEAEPATGICHVAMPVSHQISAAPVHGFPRKPYHPTIGFANRNRSNAHHMGAQVNSGKAH